MDIEDHIKQKVLMAGKYLPGMAGAYAMANQPLPQSGPLADVIGLEKAAANPLVKQSLFGYGPTDQSFQPQGTAQKTASFLGGATGDIVQYLLTRGALSSIAPKLGIQLGESLGSRMVQQAAIGAGIGVLSKPEPDESRLSAVLTNAALFPAFELGGHIAGKALGPLARAVGLGRTQKSVPGASLEATAPFTTTTAKDLGGKLYDFLAGTHIEGEAVPAGHVLRSLWSDTVHAMDQLLPGSKDKVVSTIRDTDRILGPFLDSATQIQNKLKLTSEEAVRVGKAKALGDTSNLSPKEQEALSYYNRFFDTFHDLASEAGVLERVSQEGGSFQWVPVRKRANYLPFQLTEEGRKAMSSGKDVVASLMKDRGLTEEQATRAYLKLINRSRPKTGSLEMERHISNEDAALLPDNWVEWDIRKLANSYARKSAFRIASVRNWGGPKGNDQQFEEMLQATIPDANSDRSRLIRKLWTETFQGGGIDTTPDSVEKLLGVVRGVQVATKLGFQTALRQPSQLVSVASNTPSLNAKDYLRVLKDAMHGKYDNLSHSLNATDRAELSNLLGTTDEGFIGKFVKFIGLKYMDDLMRKAAVGAGIEHGKNLLKILKANPKDAFARNEFKRFSIDPNKVLSMGDDQWDNLLNVAWSVNQKSNFHSHPVFLPAWVRGPFWKTVAQFQTYTFRQGQALMDDVIREALVNNNYKPLSTWLAYAASIGIPLTATYSLVTGKDIETDPLKFLGDAVMFGGPGIGPAQMLEAAEYGRGSFAASLAGPTISDLSTYAYSLAKSADRGNLDPLISQAGGQALRAIPFAGAFLSRKFKQGMSERMQEETKQRKKKEKNK